jgi:hypothetical protein
VSIHHHLHHHHLVDLLVGFLEVARLLLLGYLPLLGYLNLLIGKQKHYNLKLGLNHPSYVGKYRYYHYQN